MTTLHPTKDVIKSGVGRFDTYFIQRCESGGFDTDIYDKILSGETNNLEVEIR